MDTEVQDTEVKDSTVGVEVSGGTEVKHNTLEVEVRGFPEKLKKIRTDESISTPKMSIFGIQDCSLHFYPKGSFACTNDDHCSMIFTCPFSVKADLAMYVGKVTQTPQLLFDDQKCNEKVYGFHDFAPLEDVVDYDSDTQTSKCETLVFGVEFKKVEFLDADETESDKIVRVICQ